MKTWLTRMSRRRWSYVAVDKKAAEDPFQWLIRPTPGGQKALQVWRPLNGAIEKRWQERFGEHIVDELRRSLQSLVDQLNPELPDYLPILGYEMLSAGPDPERCVETKHTATSGAAFALPTLLSKVLLALAIEYESESRLSIAISANVLRLTSEEGIRVRDLSRLSGVSKEAIAMAVKRLESGGLAVVQAEAKNSRARALRLTAKGRHARSTYNRLVWDIEERWRAKSGPLLANLRRSLEDLARECPAGKSALFGGLKPYPEGWRASVRCPEVLPHYPMVLHRGGFPDGS